MGRTSPSFKWAAWRECGVGAGLGRTEVAAPVPAAGTGISCLFYSGDGRFILASFAMALMLPGCRSTEHRHSGCRWPVWGQHWGPSWRVRADSTGHCGLTQGTDSRVSLGICPCPPGGCGDSGSSPPQPTFLSEGLTKTRDPSHCLLRPTCILFHLRHFFP